MPGRLHSNATLYRPQLSTYVGSYRDVLLLKRLFGQIDVSMVQISKSPSLANLGVRYKSTCLSLRSLPRPVWFGEELSISFQWFSTWWDHDIMDSQCEISGSGWLHSSSFCLAFMGKVASTFVWQNLIQECLDAHTLADGVVILQLHQPEHL